MFCRVVSYIKNKWDNNFVDKWKHLSPNSVTTSTPSTQTNRNTDIFPGAAEWVPIARAKDDCPPFTMLNIVGYFIDRKAQDKESNNDYKNVCSKAYGLFKHGHIQKIEVAKDSQYIHVRAECLPEMKKTLKYKLSMSFDETGNVKYASCCPCPAGKAPFASCKHIAALCYAIEEFNRLKLLRVFETCTERLQTWNQPRKRRLDSERVYDIDFSRKIYGREPKVAKTSLNDPRLPCYKQRNAQDANKQLLDSVKENNPNCGFFYLFSEQKLGKQTENTMYDIPPATQQPLSKKEILDRASAIKKRVFIDDETREKIKETTKSQSESDQWFYHRKVRITASKCKRALLKPTTSPTKAIGEILGLNNNFQSSKMNQGLKDEHTIIEMYENAIGCQVVKAGFSISRTHGFLGASPDGEVDGGLVEIKRVFPNEGQTLKSAVCARNICKNSANGLLINSNHQYYYQIQLQMFCTDTYWTDLVISDTNELIIINVHRSNKFLRHVIPKLEYFYDSHILLELAYPRIKFGLSRVSKDISVPRQE